MEKNVKRLLFSFFVTTFVLTPHVYSEEAPITNMLKEAEAQIIKDDDSLQKLIEQSEEKYSEAYEKIKDLLEQAEILLEEQPFMEELHKIKNELFILFLTTSSELSEEENNEIKKILEQISEKINQ